MNFLISFYDIIPTAINTKDTHTIVQRLKMETFTDLLMKQEKMGFLRRYTIYILLAQNKSTNPKVYDT